MVLFGIAVANAPVFVPMILGLYWRRVNRASGLWAILATAIAGIASSEFWYMKIDGILGDIHYLVLGPVVGLSIMIVATVLWPSIDE